MTSVVKNPKVAIEISALAGDELTGVGLYIQNLVAALIINQPTTQFELLWFWGENPPPELMRHSNVIGKRIPLTRKLYKLLLILHLAPSLDKLARSSANKFVFPSFTGWPLSQGKKAIFIIYDTVFLDHPEYLKTQKQRFFLQRSVLASINQAAAVVAISDSTKDSLVQRMGIEPSKITVITPGLDHSLLKPSDSASIEQIKAKLGIKRSYLLYLGTLEPRKNILGIIRAYRSLEDKLKSHYQLVLAGGKGWDQSAIQSEIQTLAADQVVVTGYIDEADKPSLYSGAELFIFPSFYEGWGMPILEAQACGTPVLTADNSSLPEAGGKGAEYVKTDDQAALNQKLAELLGNPSRRQQLHVLGLKHAADFSWQKSAQQLNLILADG